ncbi:family 2A encapsulin nanocompartment cargo protein cysteine desulfurase [Leptospira neocaledonica]|uniref:Cysteine desulfurase n=1 Tax=Leptospira neocaledonica TaxID=2023192 RepID=A0A2N0A4I8_9LEPT|nr:family 2A encapsulin nanocompartment cargo protein cysteine desulfurase [Leptospira neocaledonica]PJZ79043.1 cysteine desulfurase [Leptospira neocaledonica]
MSTNDFFSDLPGEFSRKDSPPVDPNLIAEWSKKFFGPLSSGSNVDELVLSSSKIPNEIPASSQNVISQEESASGGNSWTPRSGAGYTRVPDLGLSGAGVPTFPGGLNVPGAGQGLPGQNSPFSFLDDFRSFDSKVQNLQVSDPFSFSPSLVPSVDISSGNFDLSYARKDFPILEEKVNGRNLVWLDNAATTHKPQAVIDRLSYFYKHENSNIHRGAHTLAARATDAYEAAREKIKNFLNSSSTEEIVFVRGATEAINLVAQTWGRQNIGKDDEILISWLEHHANIVPWQMLCSEKGAKLKVIPVDETGQIILSEYQRLLTPKTRLVAFTQVSNALGTVTPAQTMIELAHKQGATVLLDGAQAVSHMPVDVQVLDCDFYVFSGHKVFAPTGIGVLFGKKGILDQMTPWQGGGNMIQDVTFERTVYQPAPFRFEAGTGNIADAVGLGAAIDYLNKFGMVRIAEYEHSLLEYGTKELKKIPGLKMIGTAPDKAGVLSFVLEGFKTEDVGRYLAQEGIAVRSGHHCAQPILRRFGLESTVRPSLAFYNTCEDIDALIRALYDLIGGRTSGPL